MSRSLRLEVRQAASEAAADDQVRGNHRRFVELVSTAEALARRGETDAAAMAASGAATWAWLNHAGIHASPRLERLIRSLVPAGSPWRRRASGAGRRTRVLHVLTQAYETGGHTRWSERIISADKARVHSVVLVNQGTLPIPAQLRRAVAESAGELAVLPPGDVPSRALALRRIADDVDLIVANLHPNDVAGMLALADRRLRPPVAALNHADHAFWLGASAADLLVNFRASGERLALRRRGTQPDRSAILPLPVDQPAPMPTRATARHALGIPDDAVVLVSAGSPWKFDPFGRHGGDTFPDVLAPIVERDARARLFVLGPSNEGRWAAAARRTNGRMLALGIRTDYALYQRAADIYLDPFPMGSGYSLLEPASLGVPVLSFAQWSGPAEVLVVDSPGLGEERILATSRDEYETALVGLMADALGRRERGTRGAAEIMAAHAGPAWLAAFDTIAARAPDTREECLAAPHGLPAELDRPVLDELSRALATILEHVPALPERVVTHLPLAAPDRGESPAAWPPFPAQRAVPGSTGSTGRAGSAGIAG